MPKISVGDVVNGEVINIATYGAFIKLNNGYSGMVHISEVSSNYVHSIDHYVKLGDQIKARVIEVDHKRKQLKLSFKEMTEELKPVYRNKIVDTEHGFESLEKKLPKWIDKKIKNIVQINDN